MRLAVLAIVACSEPKAPPVPVPVPADAAGFRINAPELVTAVIDDWDSTRATLRRYRSEGDRWVAVGDAWPGVIGGAGAAWGDGLHGAPPLPGPRKREGDNRSPAGAFALRGAYGDAVAPATQLRYTHVDDGWKCVDDPRSTHYATIVHDVAVDWASAEDMHRSDVLYRWVIDVAHNDARTPGAGSCIFLHVWSGAESSTIGCTAMAEDKLAALVATLDPHTVYVLLPRRVYAQLAPAWHLP